jgi:hypothetical protein
VLNPLAFFIGEIIMADKSFVTMEQHQCLVCGKNYDTGALLMDMRLRDTFERVTVTDFGLCEDCDTQAKQGFIALVEIDPAKSGGPDHNKRVKPSSAYRTGNTAWLRREVAERIFPGNLMPEEDRPVVFVEPGSIQMLEWLANEQN